jgi:hypothetical protein
MLFTSTYHSGYFSFSIQIYFITLLKTFFSNLPKYARDTQYYEVKATLIKAPPSHVVNDGNML